MHVFFCFFLFLFLIMFFQIHSGGAIGIAGATHTHTACSPGGLLGGARRAGDGWVMLSWGSGASAPRQKT